MLKLVVGIILVTFLFVKLNFWIALGIVLAGAVLSILLFMPNDLQRYVGPYLMYGLIIVTGVTAGAYWIAHHITFQ